MGYAHCTCNALRYAAFVAASVDIKQLFFKKCANKLGCQCISVKTLTRNQIEDRLTTGLH
jgi:hypothetical protein